MPNPTTAKPSIGVYDSALTLGTSVRTVVGLCEGSGAPAELCSGILPVPIIAGGGWSFGSAPKWVPGGFASGPTLKFTHGSPSLAWVRTPFNTAYTVAGGKTFFGVIKHDIPQLHFPYSDSTLQPCIPFGAGDSATNGGNNVAGVAIDPFTWRIGLVGVGNNFATMIPGNPGFTGGEANGLASMIVLPGRWYAVAIVVDDSTTPKTRKFFLYDYTAQALHPNSGQGGTIATNAVPTNSRVALVANFMGQRGQAMFHGELGIIGTVDTGWDATAFGNFVADPASMIRGTYTPSGSLAQAAGTVWDTNKTQVAVAWPRSTGIGTGGGTGVPTYAVYRSTSEFTPPGGGTLLTHGVDGVTIENKGSSLSLVDGSASLNSEDAYIYKLRTTDGTQSVNSNPTHGTIAVDVLNILQVGDSLKNLSMYSTAPSPIGQMLFGAGYRVNLCDRGFYGSKTVDWLPTRDTSAACVQTIAIANGTANGGTFTLSGEVGGLPFTTATIAYNATAGAVASAVQAAVAALTGFSGATVAGTAGPLPAAVTLTFGGTAGTADIPIRSSDSSSLTGTGMSWGSTPIAQIGVTIRGNRGVVDNVINVAIAEAAKIDADICDLMLGTNDSLAGSVSAATYTTNITAIVNALVTEDYRVLLESPQSQFNASSAASIAACNEYDDVLDAISDDATVFRARKSVRAWDAVNNWQRSDGTHMTSQGMISQAYSWAEGILSIVEPSTGGGDPEEIDDVVAQDIIDTLTAAISAHQSTLAASQPNYAPAKAGDAMALTPTERTAVANEVENQIITETDSEKVLTAITDKIASVNPSLGGLTIGAISAGVWSYVTRVLTSGANISLAKGTGITGFNDLSAAQVNAEVDVALSDAGVTTAVMGRIDMPVSDLASGSESADEFAQLIASQVDTTLAPSFTSLTSAVAGVQERTGNLPDEPAAKGDDMGAVNSVSLPVTVGTNNDKASYSLSPSGLDAIPTTLSGPVSGWKWPQWLMFAGLRLGRARKTKSTGNVDVYNAAQNAVIYTLPTADGDTEATVGTPQ